MNYAEGLHFSAFHLLTGLKVKDLFWINSKMLHGHSSKVWMITVVSLLLFFLLVSRSCNGVEWAVLAPFMLNGAHPSITLEKVEEKCGLKNV